MNQDEAGGAPNAYAQLLSLEPSKQTDWNQSRTLLLGILHVAAHGTYRVAHHPWICIDTATFIVDERQLEMWHSQ